MSDSISFLPLSQCPHIGQHCSISGRTIIDTIKEATYCTCVQISLGSMRSYNKPRLVSAKEAKRIRKHCRKYNKTVYSHLPYVCNFGREELAEKSLIRLDQEIEICKALDIYTVIHPSKLGTKEYVVDTLSKFDAESCERIVLENAAGEGKSPVMVNMEEIVYLARRLPHAQVCIDTCHLYASGECDFTPKAIDQFLHDLNTSIGLDRVKLFHLNDSEKAYGSKVDRHENIARGRGHIWSESTSSLHLVLDYARRHSIDLIIEKDNEDNDAQLDIICLHKLFYDGEI